MTYAILTGVAATGGGGGLVWGRQLQAVAMIYAIVAAVSVLDAAAARREQRTSFALAYMQARRMGAGREWIDQIYGTQKMHAVCTFEKAGWEGGSH